MIVFELTKSQPRCMVALHQHILGSRLRMNSQYEVQMGPNAELLTSAQSSSVSIILDLDLC